MTVIPYSRTNYEWAKNEAVNQWCAVNGEGYMHQRLMSCKADHDGCDLFDAFLVKFRIARCIKRDARPELLGEYVTAWRPIWTAGRLGDRRAYGTVEKFARLPGDRGWSARPRAILTSLASRLAFMSNPAAFAPYDQYARRALLGYGFAVPDRDFSAYMDAFGKVSGRMGPELGRECATLARTMTPRITPEILRLRIVDKLLMREGGFLAR